MEANVELDTTALNILEELHDRLAADDIELWLARVKKDVLIPMKNHGVAAVIEEENMYPTLPTAVEEYRRRYPTSRHQTRTSEPGDPGEETVSPDGSGTELHDQYAPGPTSCPQPR